MRSWGLPIGFNRREFFLVRSASKQSCHPANEEDLTRRHQRRSPRAMQDFSQIRFSEIKIEQAKIAQLRRYQMLQNRFAATAAKECLVSYKNVSRTQPARLHLRDKAIRLRERPHQKPAIIRSPPGCLKPACVQIRGKAAAERVNLLRRSC